MIEIQKQALPVIARVLRKHANAKGYGNESSRALLLRESGFTIHYIEYALAALLASHDYYGFNGGYWFNPEYPVAEDQSEGEAGKDT